MPHFSEKGNDTYICQVCCRVFDCVDYPPVWRPDITKHESAGNVCPMCLKKHQTKPTKQVQVIVGVCREDDPADVDEAYGPGTYARLFPEE